MGVVSSGLSGWTFIPLNTSGVSVRWMILPKACHAAHFAIPKGVEVWHYDSGHTSVLLEALRMHPVDVVSFEGCTRLPLKTDVGELLWHHAGTTPIQLILLERGLRGLLPDAWNHQADRVVHTKLGGVSNWSQTCHAFWPKSVGRQHFSDSALLRGALSKLSDVLDHTLTGTITPASLNECKYESLDLGHWQTLGPKFVMTAPSVFSPSKWCRRKFLDKEMNLVLDIPTTLSSKWNAEMQATVNQLLVTPVMVAAMVGRCIRSFTVDNNIRAQSPLKRAREDLVEGEYDEQYPTSKATKTKPSQSSEIYPTEELTHRFAFMGSLNDFTDAKLFQQHPSRGIHSHRVRSQTR
ncbi:hypothetical protein ACA910_013826 [Epithemia clementina (nom. ined.)]